jgi:hypothetical protein
LYSNRPKGVVMAVFRVDRDLVVPLPKVNLGEHASSHLGGKV